MSLKELIRWVFISAALCTVAHANPKLLEKLKVDFEKKKNQLEVDLKKNHEKIRLEYQEELSKVEKVHKKNLETLYESHLVSLKDELKKIFKKADPGELELANQIQQRIKDIESHINIPENGKKSSAFVSLSGTRVIEFDHLKPSSFKQWLLFSHKSKREPQSIKFNDAHRGRDGYFMKGEDNEGVMIKLSRKLPEVSTASIKTRFRPRKAYPKSGEFIVNLTGSKGSLSISIPVSVYDAAILFNGRVIKKVKGVSYALKKEHVVEVKLTSKGVLALLDNEKTIFSTSPVLQKFTFSKVSLEFFQMDADLKNIRFESK